MTEALIFNDILNCDNCHDFFGRWKHSDSHILMVIFGAWLLPGVEKI